MAANHHHPDIDPNTGFCSETKIYHSLRPPSPLPPPTLPLSLTQYTLSLLLSTSTDLSASTFLIDSSTGFSFTYSHFLNLTASLSLSLAQRFPTLSPNDVAFVLSPTSLNIPVIYFALLSLGITVSPANPLASSSEVEHLVQLARPKIAFATSRTVSKLPNLPLGVILVDSEEFLSMMAHPDVENADRFNRVKVNQFDPAAILYSSGTTGRVKGVCLSHRNFIALIASSLHNQTKVDPSEPAPPHTVSLFTLPLFHVFGFVMMVRAAAMGQTLVLMERFDFEDMLKAVERYKVTYMPVSPPLVVALVKSELKERYNMGSLLVIGCGGAPLGKEVSERFKEKFPNVEIFQGYGLTESVGAASSMTGPDESKRHGSVGRLTSNMEAKVIDLSTGEALPPGRRGELWLRGPTIMKGYIGNEKATAETLDSEGWLKTGDVGYIDSEGFMYIVDRLKELIKYKAYQVPPAELEVLLQSHPDIADAAVIPFPDEEAGQIPMAYVVRKPGNNITEAEVMNFIAKRVAPYKKIRRVAFINAIPKSAAGKILRRELVNHALSGGSSKL